MTNVTKWIVTGMVVATLTAAAATTQWWLAPLLRFVRINTDLIQGLDSLVNLARIPLALLAALLAAWQYRRDRVKQFIRAGRDVISAGHDVQTGGVRVGGEGDTSVSGDVLGGDNVGGDKYEAGTIIIQQSATAGPGTSLHELPPPPADFTGRAQELRELSDALHQGGVTISGVAGVAGMGGVGKTALALRLAQELAPRYPDAQFFLDLKGTSPQPLTTADAMAHVIRGFHPEARLPDGEAELSGLYHSCLHGKRVLLLMDNAAGAGQVEPLIPPAGCVLLVTSRQHFTLPGLRPNNLDVMPPPDARELLLQIATAPRIGDHADEIARLCGYLPLALRLAARALAEHPDLSPEDYARKLTDAKRRLELVDASLGLSYDLLSEERRKLWRALAVFPGEFDAPAAAAVWGVTVLSADAAAAHQDVAQPPRPTTGGQASAVNGRDACPERSRRESRPYSVGASSPLSEVTPALRRIATDRAQEALSALVAASMVEWNESSRRYHLHDLARDCADSRLSDDERAAAQRRHAVHYESVLRAATESYKQGGEGVVRGLMLFDLEWLNIQAGQAWARGHAEKEDAAARLCSHYPGVGAHVLNLRQHPREWISWLEAALAVAPKLKDRQAEGVHLGNLGLAYADLGETRRAIEFYEQHLAIAREIGDRRGEGNALGNLGLAYADLGEPRRAIEFHEQALTIAREIGDRRREGNVLGNLGNAYLLLSEPRRAIEYHEQALAISREIGDWRGEGNALGNLGSAYLLLSEPRRAIEYHEQALAISREIGDRRGEGADLGNLGLAYAALGDARRAIEFYEQALAILRELGDRRGEGNAVGNLGNAYFVLGDARRAIDYHEQALAIDREIGDRRGEGADLGNLGIAYGQLGEPRRAIEYYEQALVIDREIGDRRGEGNALWNMALALDKLGERDPAIANTEAALAIFEQIEDPNAAKVRERLAAWRGQK